MTFKAGEEYALKLSRLADEKQQEALAKAAIYAGANIVANKVAANLAALPFDTFRRLRDGDQFKGVPAQQKEDIIRGYGITPIKRDDAGNYNAKIGFDGYGSVPTKKYPQGVPNVLLARAIESGSSVRRKTPFMRPAVNASKAEAQDEMARVVDEWLAQNTKEP